MEDRIKMNTETFQSLFPKEYQKFFINNDMVVSWNFAMLWGVAWVWHRSQYLRLKSKVPFKCYIWLKKTKTKDIRFWDTIFFDVSWKKFEILDMKNVNKDINKVIDFLQVFLDSNNVDWGVEISILAETARWRGFWFSWTWWAIASVWLYLWVWKLDIDLLNNYDDFLNSDIFKDIFLFSWKIEYLSKCNNAIWDNAINTLHNFSMPSLFVCEQLDFNSTWEDLEKVKYKFYDMWGKDNKCVLSICESIV